MPSAIQPRVVEAPGGGLIRNADPRHVPDTGWSAGRNVRFPTGGTRVRKTDGYARLDDPGWTGEPLRALWWYVHPYGLAEPTLVRIGLTGAWAGVPGGDVRQIATFATPRTLADIVTMDQYEDKLIWADGKENYAWSGTEDDVAVLIPNVAAGAIVEVHKQRLLVGNLIGQPWRVAYSDLGDPLGWLGDTAGDENFLEDSTPVIAVKLLGDHAIVHKANRLYRLINVGPPEEYIQEGVPADDGAISARAPISIGSYQYYIGRTNFYRLGSFSEPIGDAIWPEVSDAIDWPRASWVYAYRRLEYDEICWKMPARGAAQPNLTAIYNFRNNTWTLTDHDPGTCFTELPPPGPPSGEAPAVDANIRPVRGVFGQATGKLQLYGGRNADGVSIGAWVESRHFTDGLQPARVLAVPVYATGTGDLRVYCRAGMDPRQPMPPWPTPRLLALDAPQYRPWVDVRVSGRLWQVRLESNQLDDDWEVSAYGAAVITGGYAR
jgi:hypothetical protein